jgi:hypothetical protein
MATPVLLRQTATGVPEVTVTVGSERVSLPEVLARFSCSGIPTVGVRLADVVARSLKTAWRKDPAGVSKILGSSMPLLTAKDKIYAMLEKCDFCKGIGCHVCGNLGFKQ